MSSSNSFPSGLKVLVVDDDAPTLKVVSAMLQKCAYQGEPYATRLGLKKAVTCRQLRMQQHAEAMQTGT